MSGAPSVRAVWLEQVALAAEAGMVKGPEVATAVALWSYFNGSGEWSPSVAGLAARSGQGPATVRRALKRLEAVGLLTIHPVTGGRSRYGATLPDPLRTARKRDQSERAQSERGSANYRAQSERAQSERAQSERAPRSERARTAIRASYVPDQVPDQVPADDDSFRARTNVRARASAVDKPPSPDRRGGQGSLWVQPVEAPAAPAEGTPAHPLAARAAAAGRRPAKITNSTVICRCGHSLKDHNSRAVKVAGRRTGDRDTSCTFCACAALDTVPRAERPAALAAAKAAAAATG